MPWRKTGQQWGNTKKQQSTEHDESRSVQSVCTSEMFLLSDSVHGVAIKRTPLHLDIHHLHRYLNWELSAHGAKQLHSDARGRGCPRGLRDWETGFLSLPQATHLRSTYGWGRFSSYSTVKGMLTLQKCLFMKRMESNRTADWRRRFGLVRFILSSNRQFWFYLLDFDVRIFNLH